jgi:hypothetical protein
MLDSEKLSDVFKKGLLLFQRPARSQSNLNNNNPVGPVNVQIVRVIDQVGPVLGDYLKAVALRDSDCFDHRTMDAIADTLTLFF